MRPDSFTGTTEQWYQYLTDQLSLHGWKRRDGDGTGGNLSFSDGGQDQVVFTYPRSTATIALHSPEATDGNGPMVTLSVPCDPSFGERVPSEDESPFVWALADAHRAIAADCSSAHATVFASPDVVLSVELPELCGYESVQTCVFRVTKAAMQITQLHAELYQAIDWRRSTGKKTAQEAIWGAFENNSRGDP